MSNNTTINRKNKTNNQFSSINSANSSSNANSSLPISNLYNTKKTHNNNDQTQSQILEENSTVQLRKPHKISLENNELVIITPIKANDVKIWQISCTKCSTNMLAVLSDLKLYASIIEMLIILFVLYFIIFANIKMVYMHCKSIYEACASTSSSYNIYPFLITRSNALHVGNCRCILQNCQVSRLVSSVVCLNIIRIMRWLADYYFLLSLPRI